MRASVTATAVTLAAGALLTAAMTTASAGPPNPSPAPSPSHSTATTATGSPASPATAPSAADRLRGPHPVLVDCFWQRDIEPADFLLACGDGNSRLTGLRWTQWGRHSAVAEGVNVVNDCDPYCAAGRFHGYRVTVRLDRPEPWQKEPGVKHFTRMSLTYTDARPEGFRQVMTVPLWD
ncbi:hypothetical protein OIB37_33765 [Streptomyces sp. NBC_00820]|uniref:hypothetical protein n=1 Tax=Streptomyces sp. NBC_00820 TaxID=2975842 RepID=UPI002ED68426|nr:hypothetical protein OIB37_33765 [Streptomyces sp. NBC_00820]